MNHAIATSANGVKFELRPWCCPICKKESHKTLGIRGGKSHRYGLGVESTIKQCPECQVLFPDPFPVPVDTEALYSSPESYFATHHAEKKIEENRRIVKKIKELVGDRPRILDVGSGLGELLVAARLEGAEAVGLEFSDAMIAAARERHQVEVHKKSIEAAAAEWPGSFQAVVLNAVLEHVHDPAGMISAASQLLAPNGILYIDVPNEPNLLTYVANGLQKIRGREDVFNLSPTWPPYHVYGFNMPSLKNLLGRNGLEIVSHSIFCAPSFTGHKNGRDKLKAFLANQLCRIANLTATSANLSLWAKKI